MRQGTRSPLRPARATTPIPADPIDPTPAEAANGWTTAKLTEHVAQALASEHQQLMNRLFPEKPPLVVEAVSGFDPHNW